ncbi:MAG TPA: chemotaxis protein CheB [Rudaea sp.]|nr:chemotaxis protein CheB [Rudaea sp.]
MPNSQALFATVPVALLYQGDNLGGHLRVALLDLGAAIVYESLASNLDRAALEGSGARIVVFNLDSDSDAQIEGVYDVLDEGDYEVIFNDADASARLSGSDQARWARHLAAKILNKPEIAVPARPVWAESVPTPAQKMAAANASAAARETVAPIAPMPEAPAAPPAPAAAPPVVVEEPAPIALASPDAALSAVEAEAPTVAPLPAVEDVAAVEIAPPTPASETPTLELPVPDEFSAVEIQAPEDALAVEADAAEQDFSAALEDFARQVPAHHYDAPATDDFASQIDALFADTRAPAATPEKTHEGAGSGSPPAAVDVESLFDGAAAPSGEGSGEAPFPGVFDHLDDAAAAIPEAVDRTFKPGRLPTPADQAALSAESPVLPPDWSLEPLSDESAPAPVPTGRAAFGIDKIAAADFLAPEVDTTEAQVTQLPMADALSLELMPMEEAVAPRAYTEVPADAGVPRDTDQPAQKLKVGTSAELNRVFVLGASIGGPEAVREFLGALPPRFPALFVLVQHMGDEFLELMSAQLARAVSLTVRTPTHGEIFGHGEIAIVTTKQRLQIDTEGVVTLSPLPERTAYSPSIDLVLRDVADQFGSRAGAIIFSGMAQDAIAGSTYLKSRGGVVWTQDPNTCTISTMVDAVTQTGAVTFSGSPQELAEKMIADYGAG